MKRNIAIESTLPETTEDKPGEDVHPSVISLVARFASIREKIDEAKGEATTADLDSLAAPWFDAAVSKHPKADALAAALPTPPRQHATLTRTDVLETALGMLAEGPLLKSLIRECGEKYGAQPGDVLRALSSK